MSDFLKRVKRSYKLQNTSSIKKAFNYMGLPIPRNNEFLPAGDSGYKVFVNDTACIVRLRSAKQKILSHPLVLQPIASKDLGEEVKLDIMPGVTFPAKMKHLKQIRKLLARDQILFFDDRLDNIGLLPNGTPVVIDSGAVRDLSDQCSRIKQLYLKIKNHRPHEQDKFFASLKKSFNHAWPKKLNVNNLPADQTERMRDFWQACATAKENGVLIDGWNVKSPRSRKKWKQWEKDLEPVAVTAANYSYRFTITIN